MRIVTELDAGPVFRTATRADRTRRDDAGSGTRAGHPRCGPVTTVVDELAGGRAESVPQDHSRATYANKVEKHEGAIDWDLPAARIHDLVRGLQPWPLVSATARRHAVPDPSHRADGSTTSEPGGTIIEGEKGELLVATGDGWCPPHSRDPARRQASDGRARVSRGPPVVPGARFLRPAEQRGAASAKAGTPQGRGPSINK